MNYKYFISVYEYENAHNHKAIALQLVELANKYTDYFGEISNITLEDQTNSKIYNNHVFILEHLTHYDLTLSFHNKSVIQLYVNLSESRLMIHSENLSSKKLTKDILLNISQELLKLLPNSYIDMDNFTLLSKSRELVYEINPDFGSEFYYFLAHANWLSIYPPKRYRTRVLLPMPDSFYLNIPAYKTQKLDNGSFMVQLYEDPTVGDLEGMADAVKKAIEYYKATLEKYRLWKVIRDIGYPDEWINKTELLRSKGFDI